MRGREPEKELKGQPEKGIEQGQRIKHYRKKENLLEKKRDIYFQVPCIYM